MSYKLISPRNVIYLIYYLFYFLQNLKHNHGKYLFAFTGNHHAFVTDISSSSAVNSLLKDVQTKFSRAPCCVVNCAGITRDRFLLKMTEQDFDEVINVNLKGTFLITQAAARAMAATQVKNGSIVNISSIVAKVCKSCKMIFIKLVIFICEMINLDFICRHHFILLVCHSKY